MPGSEHVHTCRTITNDGYTHTALSTRKFVPRFEHVHTCTTSTNDGYTHTPCNSHVVTYIPPPPPAHTSIPTHVCTYIHTYTHAQIQTAAAPTPAFQAPIDTQLLKQQKYLSEEDQLEQQLNHEEHKNLALRQLIKAKNIEEKEDPLWAGVHLTKKDLEPQSKEQEEWEKQLWKRWDKQNKFAEAARSPLDDRLFAAEQTARTRKGCVRMPVCVTCMLVSISRPNAALFLSSCGVF